MRALKLISPWVLLGEKMAEGASGGAAPHRCILDVGRGPRGGRPARAARRARALAPWPALGPWPAARAAGEGRCERGLCRYITFCCEHPQENQPAALNEALCSAIFFFFNFPSPPHIDFFWQLSGSLPAVLRTQQNGPRAPGTLGMRGDVGLPHPKEKYPLPAERPH